MGVRLVVLCLLLLLLAHGDIEEELAEGGEGAASHLLRTVLCGVREDRHELRHTKGWWEA